MGLVSYMAKEMVREIGNKSREFYEFVLPPIDMFEENDNLIVKIDIPGFDKNDIKLTIQRNILSINAEKKDDKSLKGTIVCKQRPSIIDKKIRLPIRVKEGEEKVNSAKYSQGVLTITIPTGNNSKKFIDDNRSLQLLNAKPKSNTLLSGSILSSAIFIGSAILYSTNEFVGLAGMIGSLVVMGIFAIFRKR